MPNELIEAENSPSLEELDQARNHFLSLDSNPLFSASSISKPYIPATLLEATHVWIRSISDSGLKPRYLGPHKLLSISGSVAKIDHNGKIETINISRLKPAFGIRDNISSQSNHFLSQSDTPDHIPVSTPSHMANNNPINVPDKLTGNDNPNSSQQPSSNLQDILPRSILRVRSGNFHRPVTRSQTRTTFNPWVRELRSGDNPNSPIRLHRRF